MGESAFWLLFVWGSRDILGGSQNIPTVLPRTTNMKFIQLLFGAPSITNIFILERAAVLKKVNVKVLGSRGLCTSVSADKQSEDKSASSGSSSTTISTGTKSVSKSWASDILADKKKSEVLSEEEGSKIRKGLLRKGTDVDVTLSVSGNSGSNKVTGTNSSKRPSIFRRRLEDMSWTTEKMDDKLIWVDCEMTGLDYNKEMIMEIGCIITDPELNEIARQPSVVISVPDEMLNNMDVWCLKHHGDSGLTESCRQSTLTSSEVDDQLFEFVKKYTKNKECPMAGNSIYMDRIFISKQFPKFHSHFHYRNVDVSSVKELVRRWFPDEYNQAPKKKFSHRVLDDIIDSIAELKFYRSAVFREPTTTTAKQEEPRTASNQVHS